MRYVRPAIVQREWVEGLLDASQSDIKRDSETVASDVHAKDQIVPVRW
jgi:hypothetical protein